MNNCKITSAMTEYLDRGMSVIPLHGKRPATSWKAYQDRHANRDDVADWRDWFPRMNVGIVTGAISGIVVVDFDSDAAFTSWQQAGLPTRTPTVITGRGRHLYFAHPGNTRTNRQAIMERVDVRGDGGMVVAPPSIHPTTGEPYQWADGLTLDDMPLAPLPEKMFARDANAATSAAPAESRPSMDDTDEWWALLEGLPAGRVAAEHLIIEQGRRNSQLVRLAGKARRCCYTDQELADRLHYLNDTLCRPPLALVEVERILRNAQRFPRGDTRSWIRWLRECAVRAAISGRTATTLLRVLDAHLDIACAIGRSTYTASVREIAVRANVTTRTVVKRQFDLINSGVLIRERIGVGMHGSRWRISPNARAQLDTFTRPLPGGGLPSIAPIGH